MYWNWIYISRLAIVERGDSNCKKEYISFPECAQIIILFSCLGNFDSWLDFYFFLRFSKRQVCIITCVSYISSFKIYFYKNFSLIISVEFSSRLQRKQQDVLGIGWITSQVFIGWKMWNGIRFRCRFSNDNTVRQSRTSWGWVYMRTMLTVRNREKNFIATKNFMMKF